MRCTVSPARKVVPPSFRIEPAKVNTPRCAYTAIVEIRVECYAGHKTDQRPLRFTLGEREYRVEQVVDQWYGPDATWFRVRADEGNLYVLRHSSDPLQDLWTLEAFRRP